MNIANNINDILIYDKSENLINLLKHYCGSNVELIFCKSKKELTELNFKSINSAYVSSNERNDLSDILEIFKNVDNLYVNTQSTELKVKLETLKGVVFFDLDNDKFKIINQIFNKIIGFD